MPQLKQSALGFIQVYAVMVGIMVAASTIAFMPIGWSIAGPAFLCSMALAAVNAIIVGLNFCELATQFPRARSFVDYFEAAFGLWAGIGITLLYLVVLTLAGAGAFVIIGGFLASLVPVAPWWLWGLLFYGALLLVNVTGVQVFGWTELAMTVAMIGSLWLLSILALADLGQVSPALHVLAPFAPHGLAGIFQGAVFAVWLFVGFEITGPLIEEIRSPHRVLPAALLAAVATIFFTKAVYFLAEVSTTDNIDTLVGTPGPQIVLGGLLFGAMGTVWLTVVSIIAEGSSSNSAIGGLGRLLYVLGQMRVLPRSLGQLHPRFQTPAVALTSISAVMLCVGLAAGPERFLGLFMLATFTWLTTYFLFCLTVIVLRWRRPGQARPFSVGRPARFPMLSLMGMLLMLFIFAYSPGSLSVQGGAVLLLCCGYGALVQLRRSRTPVADADGTSLD